MNLSDYLNSLPPERRQEARADFDALPEPEGELEDLFEQSAYERAAQLDPDGKRISRVVVRLSGGATASASLDDTLAESIVGAFGREVKAAAGPEAAADAKLRLVGFSAGSVVLHYEPVRPTIEAGADGAAEVYSAADHAIETVLALHKAIEMNRPAAEIQSLYKPPLLRAARSFIKTLDKESLDISTRWYGPIGNVSSASVTDVGRQYALRTLFDDEEASEADVVSGLVTVLDIEGAVTVAAGKRRPVVKVPVELITDGSFVIGKYAHMNVTKTFLADPVGLKGDATYSFVSFLDSPPDTLLDPEAS